MSKQPNFVERVLAGDVLDLTEIDGDIDAWHTAETSASLAEWLGFRDDEYALFVERPEYLRVILAAHKSGTNMRDLLETMERDGASSAVRGATMEEVAAVRAWLKRSGRL